MWRSVIVYDGERLSTLEDRLIVERADQRLEVPISDLFCVVVDNPVASITLPLIAKLAEAGVVLVTSDQKHLPVSVIMPLNQHYRSYKVIKQQFALSDDFTGLVWAKLIQWKIFNQAEVLERTGCSSSVVNRLRELSNEVLPHDPGNREGIAAKMFFRELYGSSFLRFEDNDINAAMNYGYAIIRSAVAKSLVSYGFNCAIGIHHISETNSFNLADDFMEPFRPLVDEWVNNHNDEVSEGLTKHVKTSLVNLLNCDVYFANKKTSVRYAMDQMIKSFVTAVESNNPEKLSCPYLFDLQIIRNNQVEESES